MIKPVSITPLLIGIALMVTGCALLQDEIGKSADLVGEAFAEYCANMPASERPAYRAQVEEACGCTVVLTCPE